MKQENEVEIKLTLPKMSLVELILKDSFVLYYAESNLVQEQDFEAIYLDSVHGKLQKSGYAYRIRKEDQRWVATVKTRGVSKDGLHERREYNVNINEPIPRLDYFVDHGIDIDLKNALGDHSLIELFRTIFTRKTIDLNIGKTLIELAIDIGEIVAGDKREPIAEVELELKSGEIEDLLKVSERLINKYGLVKEDKSKFYRGLLLTGNI
ncbi:CYTH domain-containing protein [Serpentinicella sp. ANB-PHB4]|uniref:CYTH domain-containing protein n=1 Tax=Serpentinicella sp. ANB-PHB4 TaxID=3074076 RepID=UPI00285D9893|nr:CYTH domain-containing protein [Serpentinicella sp. ANB-PHB4]MDR5659294.1 CYTH domain-containing protein [Serpentinicella sp. ANB-PHB4]